MENFEKKPTIINVFNYIYIFYAINYAWISSSLLNVDSRGYLLLLMSLIVVILNLNPLILISKQRVYKYWCIWTFFSFVNYYLTWPHIEELIFPFLFRYIFVPLICMLLIVSELKRNVNMTLLITVCIFLIYSLVAPVFDPNVFIKYEGVHSILGNSYALVSTITLFILVLLRFKKKINILLFILLAIVITSLIVLTGTRKAFMACIIILFFYVISLIHFKKAFSYVIVFALLALGWYGYEYAIDNTIDRKSVV